MYLLPKMDNTVKAEFVRQYRNEFQNPESESDILLFWEALLMTTDVS